MECKKYSAGLMSQSFWFLEFKKVVAGYMKGYRENAQSLYALYCTVDLYKKLEAQSVGCIFMNIE